MPLKITHTEKYQLFYLKKAINELLCNYDKNKEKNILNHLLIKEDHLNGCNYINKLKIPVTFPLYIKDYIEKLEKQKLFDYNFIGVITPKRNWVMKYKKDNSIIQRSNRGRIKEKYTIDTEYYDILCKSKFTLTPTGDCPWSYRFFEAILSLSIPILEKNSNDIYMKDYFCYYEDDKHIYYKEKALNNYNKFINSNHFLQKNILDLVIFSS